MVIRSDPNNINQKVYAILDKICSKTDSIWIRADDAYFVGEIYTL